MSNDVKPMQPAPSITRYSPSAWLAIVEAKIIITRVFVSNLLCRITSSKAQLSKSSINSGSVFCSLDSWPGKSSSWFFTALRVRVIFFILMGQSSGLSQRVYHSGTCASNGRLLGPPYYCAKRVPSPDVAENIAQPGSFRCFWPDPISSVRIS